MYYKELRVWIPDEEILDILFYPHEKFFLLNYINKPYIIFAVRNNTENFFGFGADGNIYYLERSSNRVVYVSSALAVFGRQLKLYRDHIAQPETIDEHNIEQDNSVLAKKIEKLDKKAFSDENNFWSVILKQEAYCLTEISKEV